MRDDDDYDDGGPFEDDDFEDVEFDDEDDSDVEDSDADDDEVEEKQEKRPKEEPEEVVARGPQGPQDDEDVTGTLESFGARLERDDEGWVWRVFLYEKGGRDEALEWVKKLPKVRELWVVYTKVTPAAIDELQAERPEIKIYR